MRRSAELTGDPLTPDPPTIHAYRRHPDPTPVHYGTLAFADARCITRWSDDFDGDTVGVGGERLEVGSVAGDDSPAWFGECDEERVHCGTGMSEAAELCRSSCGCLADLGVDDAGLEESIRVGVASGMSLQRFDEHHRRHDRWPQLLVDK